MDKNRKENILLPAIVFVVVSAILTIVQTIPEKPLLLAERLFRFGGWIQVAGVAAYAALLAYKMQFREKRSKYRVVSWTLFSIVFYSQLLLGMLVDSAFLLSGKLHLPVPAIIIAGPLYRSGSLFMIILFSSTLALSGPAWCSHLCYFGAFDALAARGKRKKGTIKLGIKLGLTVFIISVAIVLRLLRGSAYTATLLGILAGIAGVMIILLISRKNKRMYHCTHFCPIGTIVNYLKLISPFRYRINSNCVKCNRCIDSCSYFALSREGIMHGKIGKTCTYCGDCLEKCNEDAMEYGFLNLSPKVAEKLWIIVTVCLHSVFLAIARV